MTVAKITVQLEVDTTQPRQIFLDSATIASPPQHV
jgi:hypothetical protein